MTSNAQSGSGFARTSGPPEQAELVLPRRDWLLLPGISLLTICLLAGSTEFIARRVFSVSNTGMPGCVLFNNSSAGLRAVPNSVCWVKDPEGPPVEYRFNSRGHRAGKELLPKQPGIFRIVMVGSSTAMGDQVAQEKTFAALLPNELSQRTGRSIELYNEAMVAEYPQNIASRFDEVLAAKPDMILWIITPFDIRVVSAVPLSADVKKRIAQGLVANVWSRMKGAAAARSMSGAMAALSDHSRAAFLTRHFLFQSQSQYVKSYLMGPEGEFLKTKTDAEWQSYLSRFTVAVAAVEDQAKAAGVPLVAVLVPYRAQVAMVSMGQWPPGCDPYQLDNKVRSIIESDGGIYVDVLPAFRTIPNPEQGFFSMDTHPDAEGHRMIALSLAKELTSRAVPQLVAVSRAKSEIGFGR